MAYNLIFNKQLTFFTSEQYKQYFVCVHNAVPLNIDAHFLIIAQSY